MEEKKKDEHIGLERLMMLIASAVVIFMENYQQNMLMKNKQEIQEMNRNIISSDYNRAKDEKEIASLLREMLNLEKDLVSNQRILIYRLESLKDYLNNNKK